MNREATEIPAQTEAEPIDLRQVRVRRTLDGAERRRWGSVDVESSLPSVFRSVRQVNPPYRILAGDLAGTDRLAGRRLQAGSQRPLDWLERRAAVRAPASDRQ